MARGERVAAFLCCVCVYGASAFSVGLTKRMSYTSPQGDQKMILESAERRDLDSSASAYVDFGIGDGQSAHFLSQLHGVPRVASPPAFSYQVNHEYPAGPSLPVVQFAEEGSSDGHRFLQENANKATQGYDTYDDFQKGLLKKFEKKGDSGFYDKAAGSKKAHTDVAGYEGSSQAAAKGEKGSSSGEVASHKKGHKTTGYHNVYHKDEYKKEQVFYDESDHRGFTKNHGNQKSSFDAAKSGFEKGSESDAAHQEAEAGRKGFFQKGKSDEGSNGYRGASGVQREFSQQSEKGQRGGDEFEKRFGFEQ